VKVKNHPDHVQQKCTGLVVEISYAHIMTSCGEAKAETNIVVSHLIFLLRQASVGVCLFFLFFFFFR
jgi:hypothetical protein